MSTQPKTNSRSKSQSKTSVRSRTNLRSGTSLRHEVGQLFIVGLTGPVLDAAERAWLRLLRPGGMILFRRNIEEAAQTTTLLREATEAAASNGEQIPALRAIDLEGGLVDRLRDLLGASPSAAMVAATGKARDAKRHGDNIGRAVRLLGFNTTFAPVLDLALPEAAPVMRTRVYGQTAEAVTEYAKPFLKALRAQRVLGCGKHFPGLGGGTLDSHAATPVIRRTWGQLWDEDMVPYRALLPLLPIIMVGHAGYPLVAAAEALRYKIIEEEPASVSRFWIGDVLRRRIGYEGLILSDDMEMSGLLSQMSLEEAAVRSIAAGCDMIEICKEPALIFRAYEAVLAEAERSPAFRAQVRRACRRVVAHKQRLLHPQLPRPATEEQLAEIRAENQEFMAELEAAERAHTMRLF